MPLKSLLATPPAWCFIHILRESCLPPSHNLSLSNFDTSSECSSNGNHSVGICCTCCVVKSMPLGNCPILCHPFWSSAGQYCRRFWNKQQEEGKGVIIKLLYFAAHADHVHSFFSFFAPCIKTLMQSNNILYVAINGHKSGQRERKLAIMYHQKRLQ